MLASEKQVQALLVQASSNSPSREKLVSLLASPLSHAKCENWSLQKGTFETRLLLAHVHVGRSLRIPETTSSQEILRHVLLSTPKEDLEALLEKLFHLLLPHPNHQTLRSQLEILDVAPSRKYFPLAPNCQSSTHGYGHGP